MTVEFAKAAASGEGRLVAFAGNETRAAAEVHTARWFFRKRTLCIVGLVAGFLPSTRFPVRMLISTSWKRHPISLVALLGWQ